MTAISPTEPAAGKRYASCTRKEHCPICGGRRLARFFQFDNIWCNPQFRGHQGGEDGGEDFLTEEGYREWIARCDDCGALFRETTVDFDSLETCYSGKADDLGEYRRRISHQRTFLTDPSKKYGAELKLVLSVLDVAAKPAVLDIGCREGTLALGLQDAGCTISVCEPNRFLCAVLAEDYRFETRATTFRAGLFPPASFDMIIALEVLHRVDDPVAFLRAAWGQIKPGGHILVGTNNQYGLATNYVTQQHRTVFSAATLERVLQRSGFAMVTQRTEVLGNSVTRLLAVARKVESAPAVAPTHPIDTPWRQRAGLARVEFDITPVIAIPDPLLYPALCLLLSIARSLPAGWAYRAAGILRVLNRALRRFVTAGPRGKQ